MSESLLHQVAVKALNTREKDSVCAFASDTFASPCGGPACVFDAVWCTVLGGGLLGPFLDPLHLSMLDCICRPLRAMHLNGWRLAWEGWSVSAELRQVTQMLRTASAEGCTKHTKILLQRVVAEQEKAQVYDDVGRECLFTSVENGHVEVVKVLLEVGGRDLAMVVRANGDS